MSMPSTTNKRTAGSTRGVSVGGRIRERTEEQGESLTSTTTRPVHALLCSVTRSKRLFLALTLLVSFDLNAFAQSPVITTYAGRSIPINGAPATTQWIGNPLSVISDGDGGFYMANGDFVARVSANGLLTLIAGNGTSVSSGDGGSAAAAGLSHARGLALDRAGNLLIAEASAHRIRKVSPEGVISTVAGNGTRGFSGDGGLATTAQLNLPGGVAVDAQGNLFIADSNNQRIRKVAPDGMISTVAGNGVSGFGGDGGPAASAMIGETLGIAADAKGNLFIADARNQRVRQITPNGIINTVARITQAGWFGSPVGVAVDEAGNLFVADSFFHTIWKNPQDGLSAVAGDCRLAFNSDTLHYLYPCNGGFRGDGGPATAALLLGPSAVAVDATGNLFIADSYNNRIRKVTPNGVIGTVAGNGTERFTGDDGPATAALLNNPTDVAVDAAGNLFIADRANYRIRKVTPPGIISTIYGGRAAFVEPESIAVDGKGNLWIAWSNSNRIQKVSPDGVISTVAGNGRAGFSGDDGPATAAQLNFPRAIDVDAQGNLFIADMANYRIRKVTPDGVIRTLAGDGTRGFSGDDGLATAAQLGAPVDVAVDAQGNIFIPTWPTAAFERSLRMALSAQSQATGHPDSAATAARPRQPRSVLRALL